MTVSSEMEGVPESVTVDSVPPEARLLDGEGGVGEGGGGAEVLGEGDDEGGAVDGGGVDGGGDLVPD